GSREPSLVADDLPGPEAARPGSGTRGCQQGRGNWPRFGSRLASAGLGALSQPRLGSQHRGAGEVHEAPEEPRGGRLLAVVLPGHGPLAAWPARGSSLLVSTGRKLAREKRTGSPGREAFPGRSSGVARVGREAGNETGVQVSENESGR